MYNGAAMLQIAALVARNLVPAAGVLFLGWSAPDVLVLYFVDTVLAIATLLLLVAVYLALSRGLKLPLMRLLIVIGLVHLYLRYARNAELLATLAQETRQHLQRLAIVAAR